ncbi:MAG: hypothetical protein QNJ87_10700 [Gammaproteobacteria bacterium]|nr:hypothetical protein [Gammaproteobacteria bacterium]MDJ0872222.1 hypothetical protein [Gammaproteobacteria bacterium]MDJ0891622.1 hypothetical protein [Gammaproteobacteria bacterium]
MAGTIIQLEGSTAASIVTQGDGSVRVAFGPAMIVKSEGIPQVDASTLWTQSGNLIIGEADIQGKSPELPALLAGGSMETAGLKYVDMSPIPLDTPGYAQLRIAFEGGAEMTITGTGARLELEGMPKYVKHIEETQPPG